MEKLICAIVLSFFVYGVCGWIWESFLCPILTHHKIHNSGFLNGPIVPIYGVGAIVVSLLFNPFETYYSIFIEGAFVACFIEYLTSWGMEKLYHQRWWDYSDKAFNLNGRICLEGFVVFGLFSVIAVKFIQPALIAFFLQYSFITLVVITTSVTTLFATDLIITLISMAHLVEKLETISNELAEEAAKLKVELSEKGFTRDKIWEIVDKRKMASEQIAHKRKYVEKRILKAFPELLNKGDRK